jgi:hypothetical protein
MIRKLMNMVGGAGIGAGAMYFFDPEGGRRRRTRVRDRAVHYAHKAGDTAESKARDLAHRTRGLVAEALAPFRSYSTADEKVYDRVRAKLGYYVSHPHAIQVEADSGRVILSGPILRYEIEPLLRAAAAVAGVQQVENRLEAHDRSDAIPALQGAVPRASRPPERLRNGWSLAAGVGGASLAAYGLLRRGPLGYLIGLAGVLLLARGATHRDVERKISRGS